MDSSRPDSPANDEHPAEPSNRPEATAEGEGKSEFPPFSKKSNQFLAEPRVEIIEAREISTSGGLDGESDAVSQNPDPAAAHRARAQRFRGGRMGGGTRGWGFDEKIGDSDRDSADEKKQKKKPSAAATDQHAGSKSQSKDRTCPEPRTKTAQEQAEEERICDKDTHCFARVDLMSNEQRELHRAMHKVYKRTSRANQTLDRRGKLKRSRILKLQDHLPRFRLVTTEIQRECKAAYEIIDEIFGKEPGTTAEERAENRALRASAKDQQVDPKPQVQVISDKDEGEQQSDDSSSDDGGQGPDGGQGAVQQEKASTLPSPGTLPQAIREQAAQIRIFDTDGYTRDDLGPLFKGNFRYCNVCTSYIRKYDDFKPHAVDCGTTPWNFMTKAAKDLHPKAKAFAPRYTRNQRPDEDNDATRKSPKKTSPQSRKRQREEERPYRENGDQDPEPPEEYDEDEEPVRGNRKRARGNGT